MIVKGATSVYTMTQDYAVYYRYLIKYLELYQYGILLKHMVIAPNSYNLVQIYTKYSKKRRKVGSFFSISL